MNLWIRSQDKEVLTKVVDIWKDADKNEIWSKSSFAIKNCLGIYKTKERTMEILEEIQSAIIFSGLPNEELQRALKEKIQNFTANLMFNIRTNTCLYEMPQE